MKYVLIGAVMVALATPALAHGPSDTIALVEQSVGQPVFDLQSTRVGRVDGYIDVHGTPGAVIVASNTFGGHRIVVPAQDLGQRAEGGLLLALSDSSVSDLPPYHPGRPLPVW